MKLSFRIARLVVAMIVPMASVLLFYWMWRQLTPGSPDSGRVSLVAYWGYYLYSYKTKYNLILLIISFVFLLLPLVVGFLSGFSAYAKIGFYSFNFVTLAVDWALVRAREVLYSKNFDHGMPYWARVDAVIYYILAITVFYIASCYLVRKARDHHITW